jgi:uncharacterized membrane protein
MDSASQLLVCVFDGATSADETYQSLRAFDQRLDEIKLVRVAVVRKPAEGQVTLTQTLDLKFNNAFAGRLPVIGMVVGLIAGRMGIMGLSSTAGIAIGGAAGLLAGVAMSKLNPGFSEEALQQLGAGLAVGQSAIVLAVRPSEVGYVRLKLAELGGTLVQDTLSPAIIANLSAPQTAPSNRWQEPYAG